MNEEIEKLIACFKELELKPNVNSFQSKLVMQKSAFLLDQMGVILSLHFNLYVRGPYSPQLTKILYANQPQIEKLETRFKLSVKDREKIALLKNVGLNPTMLEIMATYLFLRKHSRLSEDKAIARLKELKPFYSESDFAVGISKAKQLVFILSSDDEKEIAQENSEWDVVSEEALRKG